MTARRAFRERFGGEATHLAEAPGRVNLIGEHTDYNLLPVLPLALQRRVRIVLRPRRDGRVILETLSDGFRGVDFGMSAAIAPDPPGNWGNYVKAAAQEMAVRFGADIGFEGVVESDVPVASGLSSSSALVNAVGVAVAALNDVEIGPLPLAEAMADAERYTGTQGGGMDQAISMGGREGHAALIEFAPLRMTHVPVPDGWRFVVADTLVRAEKSGAAQEAYNRRTVECREALRGVGEAAVAAGRVPVAPGSYPALLEALEEPEMLAIGEDALPEVLFRRFRHVVTEAGRVRRAVEALREGEMEGFGALMDASHESLRCDYEVSAPELDTLVDLSRRAGARGARLTGAGFGGCMVALATDTGVESLLGALRDGYFEPAGVTRADAGSRLFVALPSRGATCVPIPVSEAPPGAGA
ncbi:MAG: galactokinase [Gemmatimonadota bacterium]|nr:galactokinase [Gemmatimonadota bacterium]MDH5759396.1 galactokinase [Gemmatimonadota bacterium]